MRHQCSRKKLSLRTAPRKSLIIGLACDLARYGRIETTLARAKVAQQYVEKLITAAKKNSLHTRRQLIRRLRSPESANCFLTEIAPTFESRQSGFTRVIQYYRRKGDNAQMALLEFTDSIKRIEVEKQKTEKKKKQVSKETPVSTEIKKLKKRDQEIKEEQKKATAEITPIEEPKADVSEKEKAKKGGFLSGLRKFLKGEE